MNIQTGSRWLIFSTSRNHGEHDDVVVKNGRAHFYIDSVERCWRTKPCNGHFAPILLGYAREIVAYDGWINESWQVKS